MLYNKNGTPVKYGLVGSSDIIGIKPIKITQDMVGQTIGVFLAVEVKATGKRVKPDSQQDKFLKMIRNNGGIAFECDDEKKIKKLLDGVKEL